MPSDRGLGISVPITVDQNGLRVFAQLEELGFSLLFWNKLDLP